MKLLVMPDPEVPASTLYIAHVRALARTMDAATLQAALEFHRMQAKALRDETTYKAAMGP